MQSTKFTNNKIALIKKILVDNFIDQRYTEDEAPKLINDIIKAVKRESKNHGIIKIADIISIIVLHTHRNKEMNFFINPKIPRTQYIDKYTTLFSGFVSQKLYNEEDYEINGSPSEDSESEINDSESEINDSESEINDSESEINDSESEINDDSDDDSDYEINLEHLNKFKQMVMPLNKVTQKINISKKIEADAPLTTYTKKVVTPFYNFSYTIKKRFDEYDGPYGTQWIHDVQFDDRITPVEKRRAIQFAKLRAVVLPVQRSPEWFTMRDGKITASDGGCVLNMNHYEPQFKFVIKKIVPSFQNNPHCYHGKKYEQIATMIYEWRMNVHVEEFGLMGHPVHQFLGASPDGICSPYKKDKKHLSKYVGRMLEIKCPVTRKIKKFGPIKDNICPIYYWVQVQLQLECCDLDECDFWQASIYEYPSRDEFLNDTDMQEPYRSKISKYEKGCLIQLLPKDKAKTILDDPTSYLPIVWADASFIYPDTIEMTPPECDEWIAKTMELVEKSPEYSSVYVDRVIYWRLTESKNVLILREKEWFAEHLPTLRKVWSYVEFFRREDPEVFITFNNFVQTITRGSADSKVLEELNGEIMETLDKLSKLESKSSEYKQFVEKFKNTIYVDIDEDESQLDMCEDNYSNYNGGSVFDDEEEEEEEEKITNNNRYNCQTSNKYCQTSNKCGGKQNKRSYNGGSVFDD